MNAFDKFPVWLKAAGALGLLAIGPITVLSFWLGGSTVGIGALIVLMIYFIVLYIVGVRRYIER